MVGPTLCPPKVHTKHLKKKKQHLSINNAADLIQFKNFVKRKEKSEVDILALPVHQPEGMGHTINHFVPIVVRRSDQMLATSLASQIKKKALAHHQGQSQIKIT